MRFKERQDKKRSFNRLLIAFLMLLVLSGLALYGIFKNINFRKSIFDRKPFFVRQEFIIPIPLEDPLKELEGNLSEKNIPFNFPLIATESGILANLSEGGQIIFSREKDFNLQINSLEMILSRLKQEGKKVKKVDFRFDKPIVVY